MSSLRALQRTIHLFAGLIVIAIQINRIKLIYELFYLTLYTILNVVLFSCCFNCKNKFYEIKCHWKVYLNRDRVGTLFFPPVAELYMYYVVENVIHT